MTQRDDRCYVKTIIASDIIFRSALLVTLFLAIIWFALVSDISSEKFYTVMKFIFFCLSIMGFITYIQIYSRNGYRLSFDNDSIFLRPEGFNFRLKRYSELRLRYSDIESASVETGNLKIDPFEFIVLTSKISDLGRSFYLSRVFTSEEDFRALISHVYNKRPDIFGQELVAYIS